MRKQSVLNTRDIHKITGQDFSKKVNMKNQKGDQRDITIRYSSCTLIGSFFKINLFIYGCVGSLLLLTYFL